MDIETQVREALRHRAAVLVPDPALHATATPSAPRALRSGPWLVRAAVVVALAVIGAGVYLVVGDGSDDSRSPVRTGRHPVSDETEPGVTEPSTSQDSVPENQDDSAIEYAKYFTSLDAMLEQSDIVAVFEVLATRQGATVSDMPDELDRQRLVELRATEAIKGIDPGETIQLWNGTYETNPQTGEPYGAFSTTPGWQAQPGQMVLAGLNKDARFPGVSGTSSDASFFPIADNGSDFELLKRSNAAASKVQTRTVDEVVSELHSLTE